MEFRLEGVGRDDARLVLRSVTYEGRTDLLQYRVTNTTARREYACSTCKWKWSGADKVCHLSQPNFARTVFPAVSFLFPRQEGHLLFRGHLPEAQGGEPGTTKGGFFLLLHDKECNFRLAQQMLNTYLPTTCLLWTIYLTHYFKLDHYDTRIMVALTGMLVIASLFVSTSSSLPLTSYMKKVDVWMIFCFLLPFAEVIMHTMVEYYQEDDDDEVEKEKEEEEMRSKRALELNQSRWGKNAIRGGTTRSLLLQYLEFLL